MNKDSYTYKYRFFISYPSYSSSLNPSQTHISTSHINWAQILYRLQSINKQIPKNIQQVKKSLFKIILRSLPLPLPLLTSIFIDPNISISCTSIKTDDLVINSSIYQLIMIFPKTNICFDLIFADWQTIDQN